MTGKKSCHVMISGRVQGVAYRYHAREMARRLGLSGWIRNLADGRVAACFQGNPDAVDDMIGWCRTGPSFAHVTEVEVTDTPDEPAHRQFCVLI